MRKLYYIYCAIITLATINIGIANAEQITDYKEKFDNLKLTPKEEFAPQKWGRIADPLTPSSPWGGAENVYVDYQNPTTGGQDGAYLKAGSQKLYNDDYDDKVAEDLLVTPAISGEVSFYLLKTSSYSAASVKIYTCTKEGDKFVKGDLYKEITNEELSEEEWRKFTFSDVPENTYLGFRLDYAGIDEFYAQTANVELKKSMEVTSVKLVSQNEVLADKDNFVTIAFDVTITNNGDAELNPGDENYSVSIINYSDANAVIATKPIDFKLTAQQTSEVFRVEAKVDAGDKELYRRFDIQENLNKTSRFGSWVTSKPYLPELVLCTENDKTEIEKTIEFGLIRTEPVIKNLRVRNAGAAPLKITSVTAPEGYNVSLETPVEIEPLGEKLFTLSLGTTSLGNKSGMLTFKAEGMDDKSYAVAGAVMSADNWYENFENGTPGNMLFGESWSITGEPSGLGPSYSTKWAESGSQDLYKLISPRLTVKEGEELVFYAAKRLDSSRLNVYYSPDRKNWTEVKQITASAEKEEDRFSTQIDPDVSQSYQNFGFKQFSVGNIPAGDWYIAFESGYARIDDIFGYQLTTVDHDLYITESMLPLSGTVNYPYKAAVTVQNLNSISETAGNYHVKLIVNNEAVAEAETADLAIAEIKTFNLSYTPHAPGNYTAWIEVTAGNDYRATTDEVNITIAQEQAIAEKVVGTASDNSGNTPFAMNWKNSEAETIYTKELLELNNNTEIAALSYDGYCTNDKEVEFNLKVWMENTTDGTFSGSEYQSRDVSEMTLVYQGTHKIEPQGDDQNMVTLLSLPLTEKFIYTGENLRIVTQATSVGYKSVYFASDNSVQNTSIYIRYDGDNRPEIWSLESKGMPVVRIATSKETCHVSGIVTDAASQEAIEGAVVRLTSGEVAYSGTTDKDGKYDIEVFQAEKEYRMTIEKDGYLMGEQTVSFAEGNVEANVSLKVDANIQDRKLTINVTAVTGESLEGVEFLLEQTDFEVIYPQTVLSADGTCTSLVFRGNHHIRIEKQGCAVYDKNFDIKGDMTLDIELQEAVVNPYSLVASQIHHPVTGQNDIQLSWNKEEPVFFDDFESYDDFAVTFGEWTGIDGDQQAAAPLAGDYANRGATQYATIINPLTVEPAWYYEYPVLRPYSGKQYAGFIRTSSGSANDDWLISPPVTVGADNILRFMAKAADVYKERFVVAITTAENPTANDFTVLTKNNYESVDYENWKPMVYDLSDYEGQTVKFAIHYISDANRYGAFMLMVDDFYVGQKDYSSARKALRLIQRSPVNPNEKFEIYLDNHKIGETEDYTYTFENVAEGDHTLGVKAIYKVSESDLTTVPFKISNEDCYKVTVNVGTNNETSADGKMVNFLNKEDGNEISVGIDKGQATLLSLPKGTYIVNISANLFDPYEQEKEITADMTWDVTLKETIITPYNITVDVKKDEQGAFEAIVKWNQDLGISDSFETYDDFATGSFGNWKTLDEDKKYVYPIGLGSTSNIVTFPGAGTQEVPAAIAPMVFNPYKTQPAMAPTDVAAMAPTGDKYVIFFSPQLATADKWLISPKQTVREGYVWELKAKGYSEAYPEIIELCISTTSDTPDSFTPMDKLTLSAGEWTTYAIDLSAYANQEVYLAVHYVSTDAFFAQVDDFYVGPAEEGAVAEVGNVQKYEIYLDGVLAGDTSETTYSFKNLTGTKHKVGIKAIYKSGASEMGEYEFSMPTGMEDASSETVSVAGRTGKIEFQTVLPAHTEIYNSAGILLESRMIEAGYTALPMDAGHYIIRIDSKAYKVIVR